MPGFTAHYLFGVQTYKSSKNMSIKEDIKLHPTAYGLGLQGPDIFFYELPAYLIYHQNIGSVAHTKETGKFLSFLLKSSELFEQKEEISIAKAYISGFFGHYFLDTTCHPYVYWTSKNKPKDAASFGNHVSLETDIDTLLLFKYKKLLPSSFHSARTIALNGKERHVIATILHYCYQRCYPELNVKYSSAYAATYFMPLGLKVLYDPSGIKRVFVKKAEQKILGYSMISALIPSDHIFIYKDPLNMEHALWTNPWDGALSKASFLDLFKKASGRYGTCLTYLSDFFSTNDFSSKAVFYNKILKHTGNLSYHSGLDCSIASDPCYRTL